MTDGQNLSLLPILSNTHWRRRVLNRRRKGLAHKQWITCIPKPPTVPAYVPQDWLHVKIGCGSVCNILQRSTRYNSPTPPASLILSEARAYVLKDWLRLKTGHKSCKSAEIPKVQFLDSLRRFTVVQFSEPPRVQFPDNLRIIDYQYRLLPLRLPTSRGNGCAYDGVTIGIYQTSYCSP